MQHRNNYIFHEKEKSKNNRKKNNDESDDSEWRPKSKYVKITKTWELRSRDKKCKNNDRSNNSDSNDSKSAKDSDDSSCNESSVLALDCAINFFFKNVFVCLFFKNKKAKKKTKNKSKK